MQRRSRLSHIPALDGVRGIAVVGVLFFHAGHMSGGFLGVDLFFTLSGYLITSLLVAEWREHGTIRLRAFWARRARRLLPALFIVLALAALYGAVLAGDTELGRLRGDGLASLFYVANWWQIGHRQSYWDIFTAGSPLAHMWSLAIEEQFYVVWPLLFLAVVKWAQRRALPWLFAITALLTAASALAMVWLHHPGSDPTRVYEGSDTRAASILVGCLAAVLVAGRGPVTTRAARAVIETAGCVAAVGIAWAWFTIDGLRSSGLFEGGLFLHSLAGAALVTAAAHPSSPVLGRALALRPLRFLGVISYGIYLYHLPVYVTLTPTRTHLRGWPLDGVHLVVTLALAVLSYRFVEQPIRRGALDRRRAPRALAAAVALVAVAIVASTTGAVSVSASSIGPAGAPTLDDPPTTAAPATTTTTATTTAVTNGEGTAPGTTVPAPLPPRRLSIVGDSVAWTIGVGLDAVKVERDVAVQNEGVWGCGISRGDGKVRLKDGQIVTEAPACPQWPERWSSDLASFQPDDVVLVLGAWDLADRTRNGAWTHPCAAGFDDWWAGEFDEALRVVGTTGATVHVTTMPFLRSDVLGVSQAESDRRVECLNTVIRARATAATVDMIDLAGWVCPQGTCVTEVDSTVLRSDGVHYNGPGGLIAARWLLEQLEPRIRPATATPTTTAAATTTTEAPIAAMPALRTTPVAPAPGAVVGRSRPLRMLFVGDSYLFDLQYGGRAALEAAGVVVDTLPRLGFGLATTWDWKTAWRREVTRFKPDVVVGLWGIFDVELLQRVGVDEYQRQLGTAIDLLSARHATVVLFGLAASVGDDRGAALTLNDVWSAVPERRSGVIYVDPDPVLSPHGVPEVTLATTAGAVRVRKSDGRHFCPGGARRFGDAMLELVNAWWAVPSPPPDWETGDWLAVSAYVDPPGLCPST
jgi:peptidoglycan/LPS O-acetylase OafA/YrhL